MLHFLSKIRLLQMPFSFSLCKANFQVWGQEVAFMPICVFEILFRNSKTKNPQRLLSTTGTTRQVALLFPKKLDHLNISNFGLAGKSKFFTSQFWSVIEGPSICLKPISLQGISIRLLVAQANALLTSLVQIFLGLKLHVDGLPPGLNSDVSL